ncbi:restriction endonuclease subunit S [Streptococcus sp. S784/96/1]|uniref:restriction endonuclease subunit S n=1 Tax=Streptococcus sp. S784/96/1 TaxID=2653499 RepID=UPI0013867B5E|nr:restriction endonuclease subunit S [Streptococcus sp. S784/96/1]
MTKQTTPAIRFQGFDGEWNKHRIGDHAEVLTGGTPKTGNSEYWEPQEIPWMSSGEINKKRLKSTDNRISKLGLENSSARWVKENSVLIALAGQGKTRGTVAINEIPLTTNQSIAAIQPDSQLDSEFIFQNLEKRYEELRLISSGDGTRGGLNKQIISDLVFKAPTVLEQSTIGTLFQTLDELLSAYKDNLANYQSFKASMLSKMFPKAGQTTPEIRLGGFDGEWLEQKLGDLAEIVRGASPRPIQDSKWFDDSSEVGWLRISDVTNQNGRIHYLEQRISELGQEKTRVLKEPHLLLSIAASVGKPVINYVQTGVHDGFLIFLNPTFDKEFMFQWLEMFKDGWNKYGQPGSQVNLNSDIVKNHKLSLPSLEEQRAIGSFFSNLDDLIFSYQDKITQLETLKKKLLQDMFI